MDQNLNRHALLFGSELDPDQTDQLFLALALVYI